jgi:hypothetical protein
MTTDVHSKTLRIDPLSLFTPARLDLVVKWRFFRHLRDGGDPDAEHVYRWHIAERTGGREPGSWKTSVDDYVTAARNLLDALQRHGFDADYPVRLGADGRLKDGAHRTACAHALGLRIAVRRSPAPSRAQPWGRDWFLRHGLSAADLVRIEQDWTDLQHDQARDLLHH